MGLNKVLLIELDKNKVNLTELKREASQFVAAKFNSTERAVDHS